jgi:hypothetical protein
MAVNDHAKSRHFRLQIELAEVVQHINGHAARFHDLGFSQRLCPRAGIDVAANSGNGRDFRKPFKNFRIPDVASVKNAVGPAQSFDGLGPQ